MSQAFVDGLLVGWFIGGLISYFMGYYKRDKEIRN